MLISRIVHKLQKISQRQRERAPCPHPFCIQQASILWPKVVFLVFVFYAHWVLQNIQIDSVIAFKMSNFFKIVVAMGLGLTQVKCRLLNSSIFYAMNFWHFFVRGSRTCIYLTIICYLPACLVPGMTFTEHFILFSFLL